MKFQEITLRCDTKQLRANLCLMRKISIKLLKGSLIGTRVNFCELFAKFNIRKIKWLCFEIWCAQRRALTKVCGDYPASVLRVCCFTKRLKSWKGCRETLYKRYSYWLGWKQLESQGFFAIAQRKFNNNTKIPKDPISGLNCIWNESTSQILSQQNLGSFKSAAASAFWRPSWKLSGQ